MGANGRRKFYAWGIEEDSATPEEVKEQEKLWAKMLNADRFEVTPPPTLDEIELRPPRLRNVPLSLADICTQDKHERALHTYGRSYMDSVRMYYRDFREPPDIVCYPRHERDIADVLDWADRVNAAVIPFGGGSSVVGGVNPEVGDGYSGAITVDLARMDRVLEVDTESNRALIEAGVYGPHLQEQLRPHGLTLRHYPQSFEFSTLGGWIATRAGGHYATGPTHIDDFVESARMITPAGSWESLALPASGAGPSPDRMVIGSEGALGIITEAWVRLQRRPAYKRASSVGFKSYADGVAAVRELAQSNLYPANCRLIDAEEARVTGSHDGSEALLVLGFESGNHPVDALMDLAEEVCRAHNGRVLDAKEEQGSAGGGRGTAAGRWRHAFFRSPYYREHMVARGICRETFETSVPWSRFPELDRKIREGTLAAIKEVTGRPGTITCRFTHVYPDGPAPYFTFFFLADKARLVDQVRQVKAAVGDILMDCRATITHHHAIGRYHMPWYQRQRPTLFGDSLAAAKQRLDPRGLMNPGVIVAAADAR